MMPTSKPSSKTAMNAALARKLPNLSSKEVSSIAAIIGQLNAKGLKVDDAFPEGVVSPDAITISGNLELKDMAALGDLLLIPGNRIKDFGAFPQGIPMQPDFMRVRLKIGR